MGHPFLSYGLDLRKCDAEWFVGFFRGFPLGLAFGFGLGLHGFGFAEENFTEAGWASLFFDLFRVGALLFGANLGAVFVLVGFADRLRWGFFFCGLYGTIAVVLGCYLEAVDEDAGAAQV